MRMSASIFLGPAVVFGSAFDEFGSAFYEFECFEFRIGFVFG